MLFAPDYLGHADNYAEADPLVRPAHIVPERYLWSLDAILRAIPDKLLGVIAMASAIGAPAFLPWLDTSRIRSCVFRPIWKWLTLLFVINFSCLYMYVGAMPTEGANVAIAQVGTAYWFAYFLRLAPLVGVYETPSRMPRELHELEDMKKSGEIRLLPFPLRLPGSLAGLLGPRKPKPEPAE
ncbi:MAG: hypothetical protein AAGB04_13845 [Pseudomonadota bacterium]